MNLSQHNSLSPLLQTKSVVLPIITSISSIILGNADIGEKNLLLKDKDMISTTVNHIQPSDKDNQLVQMAFRDFDNKRFEASNKEFTLALNKWYEMNRPRDEIVSLLKARYYSSYNISSSSTLY